MNKLTLFLLPCQAYPARSSGTAPSPLFLVMVSEPPFKKNRHLEIETMVSEGWTAIRIPAQWVNLSFIPGLGRTRADEFWIHTQRLRARGPGYERSRGEMAAAKKNGDLAEDVQMTRETVECSTVFRQWAPCLVKGQQAPAGGLLCQLARVTGHRVVLFSWRPLCLGSAAWSCASQWEHLICEELPAGLGLCRWGSLPVTVKGSWSVWLMGRKVFPGPRTVYRGEDGANILAEVPSSKCTFHHVLWPKTVIKPALQ